MPSVEGWRERDIVVMAYRAVDRERSLEGQVVSLLASEAGRSRFGRYQGCRHSWEIPAELRLLLQNLQRYARLQILSAIDDKICQQIWSQWTSL